MFVCVHETLMNKTNKRNTSTNEQTQINNLDWCMLNNICIMIYYIMLLPMLIEWIRDTMTEKYVYDACDNVI